MRIFRTPIDIPPSDFNLSYKKQTTMMGSCFTDNVGEKLSYYKFPVSVNPFGVLYNPESVAKALDILIHQQYFEEKDLDQFSNKWFSFYHDTSFSGYDRDRVLEKINTAIHEGYQWLSKTDVIIITFGTARVYKHIKKNQVVANCHKIPQKQFERYLLDVEEIVERYIQLTKALQKLNPHMHLVFTVSPVRHWKDGAVGNQQSKATLILAIQKILEKIPEMEYFPAYEIMMDELRDYRFYAEDMIHPGNAGIRYIWNRFCDTYVKKSTLKLMDKVEEIVKASLHKPFNPQSLEYQQFLKKQTEKTEQFMEKYPHIDLNEELNFFISRLEGIE
jgi:lysophospholipase L1-like esterase